MGNSDDIVLLSLNEYVEKPVDYCRILIGRFESKGIAGYAGWIYIGNT